MAESARTFLKRFLGFSIGPLVSSVIGFFTVPITTWFIMPDEFGKASMYALASTFLAMVIFMGMDQAFAREFHARTDKKTLYFNAVLIPLSLSIIASFFILIFYKPFSMLLYASVQLDAMIMLAVSLPVSVFYRFNLLLIRMQERARLYSLLNILDRVLGFTFLMLFIFLYEKSFKSIVLANFCSYISISAINVALTNDYFKKGVHIDKALLKVLVKFGLPLIPTSLLAWVFESMDRIAMRQWSDFIQIGLYSGAFKIVTVLQLFSSAFNTFWAPTVYRWYETNVEKDLFHKVSTVLFGMMSICFAFIVLFRNIIIMLLSKSYAGSAVLVPFLIYIP
ncbi:MAG TPA: oligosaccharide flippase family protein, partial [Petrotogaceae bacterium]|nr:oligosaccharide flippase family protein [Petrotogaceae bacterium]